MSSDPAAARLAEMKILTGRLLPLNRKPSLLAEQVAEYVPPLIDAAERVLELHRRSDEPSRTTRVCAEHVQERTRAHARDLPAWRRDVTACPDCTVTERYVCAEPSCRHECPDDDGWPCPTVLAITAALAGTGKEAGDGS